MGVYKLSAPGTFKTERTLYKSFLTGNTSTPVITDFGSIYPIGEVLLSSNLSGNIVFSNIPQTYNHLQLRIISRTSDTGTWNNQSLRFNSDTGSNYAFHTLSGNGSTATATGTSSFTSINDFMRAASNSLTSGIFASAVIDILEYKATNKFKVLRSFFGGDNNGGGVVGMASGLWMSASAINTITISPSGGTAIANSHFTLYGINS